MFFVKLFSFWRTDRALTFWKERSEIEHVQCTETCTYGPWLISTLPYWHGQGFSEKRSIAAPTLLHWFTECVSAYMCYLWVDVNAHTTARILPTAMSTGTECCPPLRTLRTLRTLRYRQHAVTSTNMQPTLHPRVLFASRHIHTRLSYTIVTNVIEISSANLFNYHCRFPTARDRLRTYFLFRIIA